MLAITTTGVDTWPLGTAQTKEAAFYSISHRPSGKVSQHACFACNLHANTYAPTPHQQNKNQPVDSVPNEGHPTARPRLYYQSWCGLLDSVAFALPDLQLQLQLHA